MLHEADALQVDWRALAAARGARLRLIGNLPYNISTPLLFRVLAAADAILDMHFMLQREVVDRILAAPGTAAYGRLTVMLAPRVARRARVRRRCRAPSSPAPKVASSVVRLVVHRCRARLGTRPRCTPRSSTAAFGQRRKTLRNALSRYLSAPQIDALGIDPGARAETLTPTQFGALAQAAAAVLHCAGAAATALCFRPEPIMTAYRRILAAVDLTQDSRAVAARAPAKSRAPATARCGCCMWSSSCRSSR